MALIVPTSVGALTLIGVAVMGFVPTSAALAGGADLPCRAVLAPMEGVDLTNGLTADQRQAVESWLSSRSSDSVSDNELARAGTQVSSACGESQRTRSMWMTLTAVFGVAVAFALREWGRSDDGHDGPINDPRGTVPTQT